MLLILLVLISLSAALFVYVAGAFVALILHFVGRNLGRPFPAWQRWLAGAGLVLVFGLIVRYELLPMNPLAAPGPDEKKGWSMIQFWCGLAANYFALFALILTGLIASLRAAQRVPPPLPR